MIQLVFDAPNDAAEALGRDPVEVGYSAHEGATRSNWKDDQLEVVDGTRPVVYPAAGSHANKYSAALGSGAQPKLVSAATTRKGRTGSSRRKTETIPSDRAAAEGGVSVDCFRGPLQDAFCSSPQRPSNAIHG